MHHRGSAKGCATAQPHHKCAMQTLLFSKAAIQRKTAAPEDLDAQVVPHTHSSKSLYIHTAIAFKLIK